MEPTDCCWANWNSFPIICFTTRFLVIFFFIQIQIFLVQEDSHSSLEMWRFHSVADIFQCKNLLMLAHCQSGWNYWGPTCFFPLLLSGVLCTISLQRVWCTWSIFCACGLLAFMVLGWVIFVPASRFGTGITCLWNVIFIISHDAL